MDLPIREVLGFPYICVHGHVGCGGIHCTTYQVKWHGHAMYVDTKRNVTKLAVGDFVFLQFALGNGEGGICGRLHIAICIANLPT